MNLMADDCNNKFLIGDKLITHATGDGVGVSKIEPNGTVMMLVRNGDYVSNLSPPKLDGKLVIANNNSSS
jgi:hypothetical protein